MPRGNIESQPNPDDKDVQGSGNLRDWEKNEGVYELRFDPQVVEDNIKALIKNIDDYKPTIIATEKELKLPTASIKQDHILCHADINTGEIITGGRFSAPEEKEVHSLSFNVVKLGKFSKVTNLSIDYKEFKEDDKTKVFSKRARENIKESVRRLNELLSKENNI